MSPEHPLDSTQRLATAVFKLQRLEDRLALLRCGDEDPGGVLTAQIEAAILRERGRIWDYVRGWGADASAGEAGA